MTSRAGATIHLRKYEGYKGLAACGSVVTILGGLRLHWFEGALEHCVAVKIELIACPPATLGLEYVNLECSSPGCVGGKVVVQFDFAN